MEPHHFFETERLILRPTNLEDASFLLKVLNTPKWLQFIGDRAVHTIEQAEEYILTRIKPQQDRLGYSNFTVIRKEDQVKMGFCGLYDREGVEGLDIGFAYLPAFEGKGYGTEAAKEMMRAGFEDFEASEISGITVEENIASRKLMEKLGMGFQKRINLPNDPVELLLYYISRKTYDDLHQKE
ncbi:MAG: GNAT family N-acetyltransferase [Bacteroidota bacterium]